MQISAPHKEVGLEDKVDPTKYISHKHSGEQKWKGRSSHQKLPASQQVCHMHTLFVSSREEAHIKSGSPDNQISRKVPGRVLLEVLQIPLEKYFIAICHG